MEVIGLERFLETLDKRKDVEGRERGLITGTKLLVVWTNEHLLTRGVWIVSNHVSVYVTHLRKSSKNECSCLQNG